MERTIHNIIVVSNDTDKLSQLIELLAAPEGTVIGLSSPEDTVNTVGEYSPSILIVDGKIDSLSILHDLSNIKSLQPLPVLIIGGSYTPELLNYNELDSLIIDQIPLHGATIHKHVSLYLSQEKLYQRHCDAAFQALLEVSSDRTFCIDQDMNICVINRSGFSEEEHRQILGTSVEDYIPESLIPLVKEKLKIASDNKHRVQFEVKVECNTYDVVIAPIIINDETSSFAVSAQDITVERQRDSELKKLEKYDATTGLATRHAFNEFLEKAISRASRNERTLALCYIDLDFFKGINSSFGHDAGDRLLKSVATRIKDVVRSSDFIARTGADEFAVILDEISRPEDAAQVVQKIITKISEPHQLGKHVGSTTASVGISFFSGGDETREELFKTADIAMLHAKDGGRNCYRFFSAEMQHKALNRMRLEGDLRQAIHRQELELYYQPQVDAKTGQVIALEALLRWHHGKLGMVSPAEFIPLAEETRLINTIGDWVMRTATEGNQQWWEENGVTLPKLTVAINVSVQQLNEENFPHHLEALINKSGIDPSQLEIEITETALMDDPEAAIRTLEYIKSLGVQIAIDDYGTGYSSLTYMKRLPVDILKVDLTFVRDIGVDEKTEAIIKSTVSLAHNLGLRVVAEGVETIEHVEFLREINCDILQGYYFSRPLPAEELVEYLRNSVKPQ